MPCIRCPACKLRFHAATSQSALVSCPECEAVLTATRPGDVNAWLARRLIAEMPADRRTPIVSRCAVGLSVPISDPRTFVGAAMAGRLDASRGTFT